VSRLAILRLTLWAAVAVVAAMTAGLFVMRQAGPPAQTTAIGGPFQLVDTEGRPVSEAIFAGKPHLVFFGFTRCPDVCPTTLADMSLLVDDLGADARDLVIAFVTVDPERDTPEVMKSYITSFSDRIVGLTGSEAKIEAMVTAYRAYRRKVPQGDDYSMDHTASVYLFDRTGAFRGTLDFHEDEKTRLEKVRRLLAG